MLSTETLLLARPMSPSASSSAPSTSSSTSTPAMLPRGPAIGCSYATVDDRIVRFHDECILIPTAPARKPAMLTMSYSSYSLPLWRRGGRDKGEVQERESDELTFKVPVPRFMARTRSPQSSPEKSTLSPCLVRRSPSSPPSRTRRLSAAAAASASASTSRLPIPPVPSSSSPTSDQNTPNPFRDQNVETVPLRACCATCLQTLEDGMRAGEQFSKAATRQRRRASLDGAGGVGEAAFLGVKLSALEGKEERSKEKTTAQTTADASPHSPSPSPKPRAKARPALHVDLPAPFPLAALTPFPPSPSSVRLSSPSRPHPITEAPNEDEDELFPLPSPRRTPQSSPAASPVPSPNASSANVAAHPHVGAGYPLPRMTAGVGLPASIQRKGSGSSADSGSASDSEGYVVLSHTGMGRCAQGLLTPEASPVKPAHGSPSSSPALRTAGTARKPSPVLPLSLSLAPSTSASSSSSSSNPNAALFPDPDSVLPRARARARSKSPASPGAGRRFKPFTSQQFWKAGADVLKSVSAMGVPQTV